MTISLIYHDAYLGRMTNRTEWDQETIPWENFSEQVEMKKVVQTPAGHGGVVHQVRDLLSKNAMTKNAIASKLGVDPKTVTNAIAHLKQRHNLDIRRYFNKADGKFYYFMKKE